METLLSLASPAGIAATIQEWFRRRARKNLWTVVFLDGKRMVFKDEAKARRRAIYSAIYAGGAKIHQDGHTLTVKR